jgi:uncharacterized protein
MKRIAVTGASGFIGRALVAALTKRGDFVRALVRAPDKSSFANGVDIRRLDLRNDNIADIAAAISGLDGVVHLAGESVAGRWTEARKREIHDSRELTTRNLVTAMWESANKPRVLVCASASGYYGSRGDEPLVEDSPPGSDFLAHVCIDWEREATVAEEFGTRVVRVRQGLVLGKDGGALAAMLTPFRLGVGGALGSGRQWWPWIHIEDAVELLLFALDREDLSGAINSVAPDPATNARFAQALGYALHRPSLLPAPALALKAGLGEFAGSLLASQLVLPAVAQDAEFVWKHDKLENALLDLLDPTGGRPPDTRRFEREDHVRAPLSKVFGFLCDPANLETLTPPNMALRVVTPRPVRMQRGAVIEYRLRVSGLPMRWKTLITKWEPEVEFEDAQIRGPYLLWRHRHLFIPEAGGTKVQDTIDYALGLAPLSNLALAAVGRDLQKIFDYRRSQLQNIFGVEAGNVAADL